MVAPPNSIIPVQKKGNKLNIHKASNKPTWLNQVMDSFIYFAAGSRSHDQ
jgi:hypothetical protein